MLRVKNADLDAEDIAWLLENQYVVSAEVGETWEPSEYNDISDRCFDTLTLKLDNGRIFKFNVSSIEELEEATDKPKR